MYLPVTSATASVFAVLMVFLSLAVTRRRVQVRVTHGDGDDKLLSHRIRAHGNFSEYAPLALILLGLVEAQAAPATLVYALATVFVATRVAHAIGMTYYRRIWVRAVAMSAQHLAFVLAGAWLVYALLK